MSDPFVGEIRMFGGNFAPRGWSFCNGQLLGTTQNDALFSLLGTIYGGDGRTTFALPDMRGRIPVHQGQGPGLSNRRLGTKSGAERVTLLESNLPSHDHRQTATSDLGNSPLPTNAMLGKTKDGSRYYGTGTGFQLADMNAAALSNSGGSTSHDNMMPFLCVNFIISLFGVYPSRN